MAPGRADATLLAVKAPTPVPVLPATLRSVHGPRLPPDRVPGWVSAEDVRAALARPEIYPAPPDHVDVRETHISWVFLSGDRAYKLKKPLVLPFLDYGTPQRRREMCREEVRLNRRLAPDLYLGVRAVAESADGLVLAAEDDPAAVDYLVEMRRFDEQHTLAAKLERGELKRGEIVEVARMLAAVSHARATGGRRPRAGARRRAADDGELP